MIAEAIASVVELADPKLFEVHADDNVKIFVRNGEEVRVEIPPGPRNHGALSLESLIAFTNRFAGQSPAVFYGPAHVITLLKDGEDEPRDTISFDLHQSGEYQTLCQMSKNHVWYDQKQFVRLLRIQFAEAIPPVDLLNKVRKVKFEAGQMTTGKVGPREESLGKSYTASATSDEGDIPEDVALFVPVFTNPGEATRVPVKCAVEVDAMTGKFQLVPFPGQVENAMALAMELIAKRLAEGLSKGVTHYYGMP